MPKQKPSSSAKKRFKVTGTGKIMRRHAMQSHNLEGKSAKRKRKFGKAEIGRLETRFPVFAALHELDIRARSPGFMRTAEPAAPGRSPASFGEGKLPPSLWPELRVSLFRTSSVKPKMAFSGLFRSWLTLAKRSERSLRAAARASMARSCARAKMRNRPAKMSIALFSAATCV